MAKPSAEELVVLKKFREMTSDLVMKDEQRTDMALLAWLRARDMNLQKADQMLRKSLIWRTESDIDNVLTWKVPDWIGQNYPYEISARSKDGCPVLIWPFGKWDVRKAVEIGKRDEYIRMVDQMLARIFEEMKKINENKSAEDYPVTQFVVLMDYQGFSMRQLVSLAGVQTIKDAFGRFEANYPETIKSGIIINAPRIFPMIFAVLKPLIAEKTWAKCKIFANSSKESEWMPAILEEIPSAELPVLLGGTKTDFCQFLAKDYVRAEDKPENDE